MLFNTNAENASRKKPIVESNAINGIANRGLPPNAVKHEEEEKEDTKVR